LQPLQAQEKTVLTIDQAIDIALYGSYTVRSNDEERQAMQYQYLYYKAQFKPKLDAHLYSPSWNEAVTTVTQADALPVYNSTSSIRFGGGLNFTYVLPTGGDLALKGEMYHENLKTTFQKDYSTMKWKQAYSQFGIAFNQPVFTKNLLRENLKRAEYQYKRSELYFTRIQMDIIYNVTNGFYGVYQAAYEKQINEERLNNSQEALRIAKLKYETGNIAEGELLIAEIDAAQSDVFLSGSAGKYERLKDEFKLLIGLSMTEEIDIMAEMEFETVNINLQTAIDQALVNRLEIKEGEYDIKLQEIEIDRAKRVSEVKGNISAYYDFAGLSPKEGNVTELFRYSFDNMADRPQNRGVTFTLAVPILDWGRKRNNVKTQIIYLNEMQMRLDNTNEQIIKEIREIIRTVYEAEKRFRINQKNKDIAQRSYRINRLRFENGDITAQELSLEQTRLSEVQLAYIGAYVTYQSALADLKRKTMWDFENNRSYVIDPRHSTAEQGLQTP
ncbi:MAG: TolC family protein, partial [Bacteroidales bacterium]|jgi:outer membrane protein TolC|nr:TolC family protein [Bacteroidales bacterium]